jgi:outer membrane lipoprotein-sorting protein|tara:strand:+ start:670 stop:954 length:285 start_codon:yes stop_codon:yes gene_type:complete
VEDAITTKNKIIMNEEFLFAVDFTTEEVIVSYSSKGTNKIKFIERINKDDNIMIFNAAVTLKSISESSDFDPKLFKMMDKVCQSIYNKLRESTQ